MMAMSAATAPNRAADSGGEPEQSYNSFDVTRIDDDSRAPALPELTSLGPQNPHFYSQLVRDRLEVLSKTRDSGDFSQMMTRLLRPPEEESIDDAKLFIVIRTLTRELEKLNKDALAPIVSLIIGFESWSQVSPQVTEAFLQFYKVLLSGSPKWWSEIARSVIVQFGDSRLDLTPHHNVIRQILALVPTSSTAFINVFSSLFPHKSNSAAEITSYTFSLLRVIEYAPEQIKVLWELIVQRLIELDVECEEPELVRKPTQILSDDESESDSELSDSDLDSDTEEESGSESGSDESEIDSVSDADTEDTVLSVPSRKRTGSQDDIPLSKRARMEDLADGEEITATELDNVAVLQQEPIAVKVDSVMSLLLQHLSVQFAPEKLGSTQTKTLFDTLLQVFRVYVLSTSRPQAVQFIWFFITHADQNLLASFLSLLLESAMSSTLSYEMRTRAMQYVASFVARAKGLTRPQIVFVVKFLADWVQRFIRERESEVDDSLSMARFKMFYSATQALFYIFVFRHAMLRVDGDEGQWEAGLDKLFQQAVNTKFNPLQYCQPQIVAMFARIAQNEEVASCYSIIERNRWGKFRSTKAEEANSVMRASASNGLFSNNRDSRLYDSYLPFQPLRLKKAKRFFSDIYEKWSEHDLTDSDTDRERELMDDEDDDDST